MNRLAQRSPIPPVLPEPRLAALDLGTNNCRLLIARPTGGGFAVRDSFSRIVRLGEGLASSGQLAEHAMARTIGALKICARLMAKHRVSQARCVTTEACRRAANGGVFIRRAHAATGIRLEILDHQEEARITLLGCAPLIEPSADHVLMVDIGGGSTELVWLDRRAGGVLRCVASVPLGVVTLTEAFTDQPDRPTFEAMIDHVAEAFLAIERTYGIRAQTRDQRVQLLGTSGTVTTLAAVLLELPRYDRNRIDGLAMAPAELSAVADRLRDLDHAARLAHPCIGPGRADLVLAGCAILEAILRCWPVATLRVADRGLREGLLQGLIGRTLEQVLATPALPA